MFSQGGYFHPFARFFIISPIDRNEIGRAGFCSDISDYTPRMPVSMIEELMAKENKIIS